ncbi:MAG: hypothetical protein K9M80_07675 [Candidatus Marinimicrobia bacterium]|nr:hypothetical protein [Candidatus Neomarinimicrobiota bacterium]
MTFWNLIPVAADVAARAIHKPRKKNYISDTSWIDRYVASLKGRKQQDNVYNQYMRPALRRIGQRNRQSTQNINQQIAKQNLSGSGIATQARLSSQQNYLNALASAHDRAMGRQQSYERQLDSNIDQAIMQKGRIESYGERSYNRAQSQWQNNLIGGAINMAGESLAQMGQQQMQMKNAYGAAQAAGLVDPQEMSFQEFKINAQDLYSPENYVKSLHRKQAQERSQQLTKNKQDLILKADQMNKDQFMAEALNYYDDEEARQWADDLYSGVSGEINRETQFEMDRAEALSKNNIDRLKELRVSLIRYADQVKSPPDWIPKLVNTLNSDINNYQEEQIGLKKQEYENKLSMGYLNRDPDQILKTAKQVAQDTTISDKDELFKTAANDILRLENLSEQDKKEALKKIEETQQQQATYGEYQIEKDNLKHFLGQVFPETQILQGDNYTEAWFRINDKIDNLPESQLRKLFGEAQTLADELGINKDLPTIFVGGSGSSQSTFEMRNALRKDFRKIILRMNELKNNTAVLKQKAKELDKLVEDLD